MQPSHTASARASPPSLRDSASARRVANARLNHVADLLDLSVLADRWRPVAVPGGAEDALIPPVDIAGGNR